ncbi:hypothetical protein NKH77_06060 [Streptomyces sp. M19]
MAQETLTGPDTGCVPLLRRDRPRRAGAHRPGDRPRARRTGRLGPLPRGPHRRPRGPAHLPFQRKRYWLEPGSAAADVTDLGQLPARHPLLGAVVAVGADGVVLTGRLSTRAQPWLADHVISGRVLFPGTAFAELALRAGDHVGAGTLEELTLGAPWSCPPTAAWPSRSPSASPTPRAASR